MDPTVEFVTKSLGVACAYGTWAFLVYKGLTPADGFVAGLLSLISFLTGNAVGKSGGARAGGTGNGQSGQTASTQSGTASGSGMH